MELLFFKYDHSKAIPKPATAQLAALHSPMDLVVAQSDGWRWGDQERGNAWFRVLVLPASMGTLSDAEQFLAPLMPALDSNRLKTTLWQRRSHYIDLVRLGASTPGFTAWWADDTRALPAFNVPPSFPGTLAGLATARPAIPDPKYTGTPAKPKAITA